MQFQQGWAGPGSLGVKLGLAYIEDGSALPENVVDLPPFQPRVDGDQ